MTAAEPSTLYDAQHFDVDLPLNDVDKLSYQLIGAQPESGDPPLKIALLGYRSHPFVGGQGIYLHYLSKALVALGHRVDVLSGPPYPELAPGVKLIKIPSLDLFAQASHVKALRWRHLRSFTDTFEWWSMLSGGFAEPYTFCRRVAKRLQHSDYDIIHDNQSLGFGLLSLQDQGFNVVSTIHHPIHRDRALALAAAGSWRYRLLTRRWYSFLGMQEKVVGKLKHVITVSRSSQGDIARDFKRPEAKTPVICNGIDTDVFRPLPDIEREPLRLITTASSDQPLKGLSHLLEAVKHLLADHPGLHLRVIGKLKEDGDTARQLRRLNIDEHVSFVSGISTEALVEEYARASIAVCPSLYEGFGLPAGEAMACGLPLVSTRGGALAEVVGGAGHLVEPGSSEALARQIAGLLAHPQQAASLGRQARQHIVEHFCWSKVACELTAYYRNIIACADH
jgi:glycosyltransferase involved in cell wall biosynthesis